jgi:hypothetical protein
MTKHLLWHTAGSGWEISKTRMAELAELECKELVFIDLDEDSKEYRIEYERYKKNMKPISKGADKMVCALKHFTTYTKEGELIGRKKPALRAPIARVKRAVTKKVVVRKIATSDNPCAVCNDKMSELGGPYCTECRKAKAIESHNNYQEWKRSHGLPTETREEELARIIKENDEDKKRKTGEGAEEPEQDDSVGAES